MDICVWCGDGEYGREGGRGGGRFLPTGSAISFQAMTIVYLQRIIMLRGLLLPGLRLLLMVMLVLLAIADSATTAVLLLVALRGREARGRL